MANKKKIDTTIDHSDEEAGNNEAMKFATETLTGDLRDFILDRLKHNQSERPWDQRNEAEQRETVRQVEHSVRWAVRTAVEIIAGHGRRAIKAQIEQITIKDGYKATLTMSKFDENRHQLADATGSSVLIVVADPDDFTGQRSDVEITPDQATLIGEQGMAVHSEPDSLH